MILSLYGSRDDLNAAPPVTELNRMSFLSYAQNFEDVLLHRVFGGQETGFYVDVGAYHPVDGSITKTFYDRGWSGINVEPGSVFANLAAARPRDVNLRMAVTDRAGEIAFIEDEADSGTSYVSTDNTGDAAARMVPCGTLEAIVSTHARGRPVDFIKIDAEGSEAAIVRSTDWRRLRPRVLLLEATRLWSNVLANQEWEPVLLEQGYVRAYFDGINCFYIPDEEVPTLLRHFQVPVNVLDRVMRHEDDVPRAALREQQIETARLVADRDTLRATLGERQTEITRLAAERETLSTALREQQTEITRLAAERETLSTALREQRDEAIRLAAEGETLSTALREQRDEAIRLAAEGEALRAALYDRQSEAAAGVVRPAERGGRPRRRVPWAARRGASPC